MINSLFIIYNCIINVYIIIGVQNKSGEHRNGRLLVRISTLYRFRAPLQQNQTFTSRCSEIFTSEKVVQKQL